jgi:hypothetical protein
MKRQLVSSALAVLALSTAIASAQNGQLDQASPYPGTGATVGYNGSASSLVWQQQVRAGITGQLEGIKLFLNGTINSHIDVRVRLGNGWNTGPVVFQGVALKTTSTFNEQVFVNAVGANLVIAAGNTFVIELQGQDDGGGFLGNYTAPPAPAQYPEPLYLNGPSCYVDCGYRIAFETYVLAGGPPLVYCTSGTTTNGCAASITASANPKVTHSTPCQINVANVEGQKTGIVFYGLTQLIQPWCSLGGGTSLLCVKPPTMRTGVQSSGGSINACDGALALDWNAFQLANPGALGNPWSAGNKVYVQGWFRDPASCKTTSLSNAIELTYQP